MASRFLPCLFLFITVLVSFTHSVRFGSRAKTLFFPPGSNQPQESFTRIRKTAKDVTDIPLRQKRQSGNGIDDNQGPTTVDVTKVDLHDHHPELLVHWVGEGRDEIICLTRDIVLSEASNTSVHISYDYGQTFQRKDWHMSNGTLPIFDRFYHSSASVSRYIFNDLEHWQVWVTTNVGQTVNYFDTGFRPAIISMHESDENVVLAMDDRDEEKKLWLSENFGASWRIVQRDVKSFYWGVQPYDKPQVLYVEREEPGGLASVLRSEDYFEDFRYDIVITGVKDFEVRDDYLFATKPHEAGEDMLDLWVSHKRGSFMKAQFPVELVTKEFYIADASEEQVFVCINHDEVRSNLYISEAGGYEFSLSLENVVYYSPEGPGKDSWLSRYADEPFADIYKVEGIRGIYIASQFRDTTQEEFEESNMVSWITYDKGGEWLHINSPEEDFNGRPFACSPNCSLHLSQKVGRYRPGSRLIPMVSKTSAPGIILGTGVVGQDLSVENEYSVFMSRTAGASWHQVLLGKYFYTFADHGGVITAVKEYGSTNEVEYSVDEGQTWTKEVFNSPDKIMVYGLMTEPGETSSTFTVFGSELGQHSWLIVQIDTRNALGSDCETEDYKEWWPGEGFPDIKCLLGRKTIYERRDPNSICYNGRDYDRPVEVENCTCTREDYECDEGYMEDVHQDDLCIKDPDEGSTDPGAIPDVCPEGESYRRSKGYRKVAGDTCAGEDQNYEAELVACPVARNPEFLLFSQRTEIHRYLLASERNERLPIHNLKLIAALDYDVSNNCYYYADTVDDFIKRYCPDGSDEEETVLISHDISLVEGLAFDWLALNIYWVDSILHKIEMARHDGRLRRTLISGDKLDQPRGLALDPKKGYMYWADWGSVAKIIRAYMDGSNPQAIVSTNIHWPNGVTIDEQTGRVYWTDAYYHRIESSFSDGSGRHVVISEDLPHPFAVAVYKNRIYWDDWTTLNIESASKHDGSDRNVELRDLDGVMDLKIFHNSSQQGVNPCSRSGGCSQLCVVLPNTTNIQNPVTRHCLCADDFDSTSNPDGSERCQCPGGGVPYENGTCPEHGSTCGPDQLQCASNDNCIPDYWRCDGDRDCLDGSDERDCPDAGSCAGNQFTCKTVYRCIPLSWHCDFDDDCHDGSDEEDCIYASCNPDQFTCANGRCIPSNWECDLDNDCGDMSDESHCSHPTTTIMPDHTCSATQFQCLNKNCIPSSWICDGDNDCGDGSDETDCVTSCQSYEFQCSSGRCIPHWWRCDRYDDCGDNSDEVDCEYSTYSPMYTTNYPLFSCSPGSFHCLDGSDCLPSWWKCDNVEDCQDGSDEFDCEPETEAPSSCGSWQFTCDNGLCIPNYWECDFYDDCGDNSDERDCTTAIPATTAPSSENCPVFKEPCAPGETPPCIWSWWVCDGEDDCSGGSDEQDCVGFTTPRYTSRSTMRPHCYSYQFQCVDSGRCIPVEYKCNNYYDCSDASDETNCVNTHPPTTPFACSENYFQCSLWSTDQCFDDLYVCNGIRNCFDASDEDDCDGSYMVSSFTAEQASSNSVTVVWSTSNDTLPQTFTFKLYYRDVTLTTLPEAHTVEVGPGINRNIWYGLEVNHRYEFTIAIKVGHVEYQKAQFIFLTMENDRLPSVPRNVRLSTYSLNSRDVGVSMKWEAPGDGFDILWYDIRYRIQGAIDGEFSRVRGNVLAKNFSSLLQGHKYQFQVRAVNNAGEGDFSEEKYVFVGRTGEIQSRPTGLHITHAGDDYIILSWNELTDPAGVSGYILYYMDKESFVTAKNVSRPPATVWGLCQATQYEFTVAGYNMAGVGPEEDPSVVGRTNGDAIPAPTNLTGKAVSTRSVRLSWDAVKGQKSYVVWYSPGGDVTQASEAGIANATSYTVSSLTSGDTYYFWVQVSLTKKCRGSYSRGIPVTLEFDNTTRPRDLEVVKTFVDNSAVGSSTVTLLWHSPRDRPYNVGYKVHFSSNGNDEKPVRIDATEKQQISYNLTRLIPGAPYTIYVTTDAKDAEPSNTISVTAAKYSPPETFKYVLLKDDSPTVLLYWHPSLDIGAKDAGFAIFQLNISDTQSITKRSAEDLVTNTSLYQCIKNLTDGETSYEVTYLERNKTYGLTVSVGYWHGYHGQFAEKVFVDLTVPEGGPPPTAAPRTGGKTGSNLWLIIGVASVLALVTLLAASLVYFVVRHQRLQRSFMSFANSHYDTRSGTATFEGEENNTDLGDEDEDQPIIRGFSDDEPLVVA